MRMSSPLNVVVPGLLLAIPFMSAQAEETRPSESYWYVGGDLGMSRDKLTTNRPGWSGKSSSNVALGARGGYQFSRYFAVEGGLSSLGQVEATSGGRKDKFTLGAVSASLVGYLPVTDRFSVLGIIGGGWEMGRRRGDVESRNASAGFLNAGVGAAYDVSPNWRVRVQYMNYSKLSWKGSNEASVRSYMITTGVDYRFR